MSLQKKKGFKASTVLTLGLMFCLEGCATHRETFDCAPGSGVGCKSISEVNAIVDSASMREEELKPAVISPSSSRSSAKTAPTDLMDLTETDTSLTGLPVPKMHQPKRAPERVLKVWIAPFEDQEGNFHEASTIHALIQESRWLSQRDLR